MNGTQFQVMKSEGYATVTAVGQGAMKPVAPGASPEYDGHPPAWSDFGLQFELGGQQHGVVEVARVLFELQFVLFADVHAAERVEHLDPPNELADLTRSVTGVVP